MPNARRVIVTRPQADAMRWVQALADCGIDALALPLIDIRPLSDPGAIADAWRACAQCQAIMFVSAAAVDHFFAAQPADAGLGPAEIGPRLWATGPGTVAALVRHGVALQRIDAPAPDAAQFDSEALWRVVGGRLRPDGPVLLVRGAGHDMRLPVGAAAASDHPAAARPDARGDGRDWLSTRLAQAGAQVRFVVAYWRAAPAPQVLRHALADNGIGDDDLWLFTSAQAIAHLRASLPERDWSRASAVTSHARIAAAARAAGFGAVRESRPALTDMAASIKSVP